jgi:hypothetical protein
MRPSRVVMVAWVTLIVILLIVEIAELTHTFTLPIQSAITDPLAFVFALLFTTILAVVGAIFIGIYISSRMLNPAGFTPFEEEMLKMRKQVQDLESTVETIRKAVVVQTDPEPGAPEAPEGP